MNDKHPPADQAATITIYETAGCMQCRTTKRYLDKQGVDYDVRPLAEPWISALKERGYSSAPGVVVRTAAGAIVDLWGGYNPSRLRAFAEILKGNEGR